MTQDIFNFTDTWNDAGSDWFAIKVDVTATAYGSGSRIMDLLVGGSSKFSVDPAGEVEAAGDIQALGGILKAGASDATRGFLYLFGAATGSGGTIRFYASADSDGTNDYYQVKAAGEDFTFELADGTDLLKYDLSQVRWEFGAEAIFEKGIIVDTSLYMQELASAPTNKTGYGQFWFSSADNKPYATGSDGTDYKAGIKTYESTAQTISGAGGLTLAHGLGAEPMGVMLIAQCTSTDAGYAVGDRIVIGVNGSESAADRLHSVLIDSTNITIRFHNASATTFTYYGNKTTGVTSGLQTSKWQLYVKAWAV